MASRRRGHTHEPLGSDSLTFTKWSSRTRRSKPSNSTLFSLFTCLAFGVLLTPVALLRYGLQSQAANNNNNNNINININSNIKATHTSRLSERINKNPLDETKYHIIISTDCSEYHNWQSYIFFYHANKVGQPGTITRIASGCSAKQEKEMEDFHYHHIESMSGRFKIHFTPSYANVDGTVFLYFNKPFGLRHWMEHVLGFPKQQDDEDAIIILLDPDMVLTRPLTRFFNATDKWREDTIKSFTVDHGKPAAQQYLLTANWLKWDLEKIAGENTPALQVTHTDARKYYVAGPPYLATAKDMYQIATKWTEFAPATKQVFPDTLAEMYAYVIAAAHLELPHTISNSFMLSDPGVRYTEPWDWIEAEPRESICRKDYAGPLPNVLHYCQQYSFQGYEYYKVKLRNKIHHCSHPLLKEPSQSLTIDFNWSSPHHSLIQRRNQSDWAERMNVREAFMTCQMIYKTNEAMEHYRTHACRHTGNVSKTLLLADVVVALG